MNMQTIKTGIRSIAVFLLALGMAAFAQAQQGQQQPPAEYYQLMGRANYAFEHAKNKADYEEAVKLFQQAANAAPWLPDTYYDLGKAQQKAEQYNDAISSLQRYLQLKPGAADRDKVNAEIEEIQGEAQQAAAQPAIEQQNQQQSQQQSDADFIQSLNGARYTWVANGGNQYSLMIQGDQLIREHDYNGTRMGDNDAFRIEGRTAEDNTVAQCLSGENDSRATYSPCTYIYTIRRDSIEEDAYWLGSKTLALPPWIFKRVQ